MLNCSFITYRMKRVCSGSISKKNIFCQDEGEKILCEFMTFYSPKKKMKIATSGIESLALATATKKLEGVQSATRLRDMFLLVSFSIPYPFDFVWETEARRRNGYTIPIPSSHYECM